MRMMRFVVRSSRSIAGVMAGLSLALLLLPGAVQANGGGYSGDAYGQLVNNGSSWGGGYVQTEIATLSSSGGFGNYANEELWVSYIGGASNSWVEVGYSANQPNCSTGLQWFWDDESVGTPGRVYCTGAGLHVTHTSPGGHIPDHADSFKSAEARHLHTLLYLRLSSAAPCTSESTSSRISSESCPANSESSGKSG